MNRASATAGSERIVRLLSDAPAEQDAFGGHDRAAAAIASMIVDEPGGRAIALEGGWGSGKSTVIKLLASRLEGAGQIDGRVLVFDAWSHEGDPLRRVFLERLIDTCLDWLPNRAQAKWIDEREKLGFTVRTQQRTETPRLEPAELLLAAALLLSPAALVLLAAYLREGQPVWAALLVSAVAVLPGLCVAFVALRARARAWLRPGDALKATSSVTLLVTKSIADTRTTTRESPDPTTREFEELYRGFLTEVLADSARRLVLVVDNLDRLPTTEAERVWATMRVFCENGSKGEDWADRLWVVVPFDRGAAQRIWNGGSSADSAAGADEAAEPHGKFLAFFDKTFHARFEVPTLVLADWKDYLRDLLTQAFPGGIEAAELYAVFRLSVLLAERRGRSPTPRDLKRYVNDIGALVRVRRGTAQMPLGHLAYYAILQRLVGGAEQIRLALLHGNVPDAAFVEVLGADVGLDLAQLVFSTDDPERARELLFKQPFLSALADRDVEALRSLALRRDFWPLAESLFRTVSLHLHERPQAAANAALAVREAGLLSAANPGAPAAVRRFAANTIVGTIWGSFDNHVGSGIAAAMELAQDPAMTRRAIDSALSLASAASLPEADDRADGLAIVLQQALDLGDDAAIGHVLQLRLPADVGCRILARLTRFPRIAVLWRRLQLLSVDPGQVMTQLVPQSESPWPEWKANAAMVVAQTSIAIPWGSFIKAVRNALASESETHESAAYLLRVLRACSAHSAAEAQSAFQNLADQGWLHHHFHKCREARSRPGAAGFFVEIARWRRLDTAAASSGQAHAGHKWIAQVLQDPGQDEGLLEWIVRATLEPAINLPSAIPRLLGQRPAGSQFLIAFLETVVREKLVRYVLPHEQVIGEWESLREICTSADRGEQLLADILWPLVTAGPLVKQLTPGPLRPDLVSLYVGVLSSGGASNDRYIAWLTSRLADQSRDDWLLQLRGTGDIVRLALEVRTVVPTFQLQRHLADALESISIDLLKGERPVQAELIRSAVELLHPSSRIVLGRQLIDHCKGANGGSELHFEIFGSVLRDTILIDGVDERDFVRRLLRPIVDRLSASSLGWAASIVELKPSLVRAAPAEDRADVQGRLAAVDSSAAVSAVRDALITLAAHVGSDRKATERAASPSNSSGGRAQT